MSPRAVRSCAVLYLVDARSVLHPAAAAPSLDWSAVGVFGEPEEPVKSDVEGIAPAIPPADVDVVSLDLHSLSLLHPSQVPRLHHILCVSITTACTLVFSRHGHALDPRSHICRLSRLTGAHARSDASLSVRMSSPSWRMPTRSASRSSTPSDPPFGTDSPLCLVPDSAYSERRTRPTGQKRQRRTTPLWVKAAPNYAILGRLPPRQLLRRRMGRSCRTQCSARKYEKPASL